MKTILAILSLPIALGLWGIFEAVLLRLVYGSDSRSPKDRS